DTRPVPLIGCRPGDPSPKPVGTPPARGAAQPRGSLTTPHVREPPAGRPESHALTRRNGLREPERRRPTLPAVSTAARDRPPPGIAAGQPHCSWRLNRSLTPLTLRCVPSSPMTRWARSSPLPRRGFVTVTTFQLPGCQTPQKSADAF